MFLLQQLIDLSVPRNPYAGETVEAPASLVTDEDYDRVIAEYKNMYPPKSKGAVLKDEENNEVSKKNSLNFL